MEHRDFALGRVVPTSMWATVLMVLTLLQAAGGWAGEVSAVGLSPVLDDNIVGARKAALEEAKRAAVEQGLGSNVESERYDLLKHQGAH